MPLFNSNTRARKTDRFQPELEALEKREVMTASAPAAPDAIVVTEVLYDGPAGQVEIREIFSDGSPRLLSTDLRINGTDMDDRVVMSGNKYLTVNGRVLDLNRFSLDNVIFQGGAGNDTFINNSVISSTAHGGRGHDFLQGGLGSDGLHGDDGFDTLVGNTGNDILDGGRQGDKLYGGVGNDQLFGGDGNDFLYGYKGHDWLFGGNHNDYLDGGFGDDWLFGQTGNDVLNGGKGDPSLFSHGRLYGNELTYGDIDHLYGGAGFDVFANDFDPNMTQFYPRDCPLYLIPPLFLPFQLHNCNKYVTHKIHTVEIHDRNILEDRVIDAESAEHRQIRDAMQARHDRDRMYYDYWTAYYSWLSSQPQHTSGGMGLPVY